MLLRIQSRKHKASATPTPPRRPERPLCRSTDDCIIGGVCGGLARRLGVEARAMRIIALVSVMFLGVGVVAYVASWIGIIRQGEHESILTRTASNKREKEIVAVVSIAAISLLIAMRTLGLHELGVLTWFATLSALGLLMVWRGSSDDEKVQLRHLANSAPFIGTAPGENSRGFILRTGTSVLFFLVGASLLSRVGGTPGAAVDVLIGAGALVLGLFVLFAPWWVRTVRDLTNERRARVRAQERADMAAHVHDSVLQTLSLIQRAAADPTEVSRLARMQERDLRQWLVDPASLGQRDNPATTLSQAVSQMQREVEDNYSVAVKLVIVGDLGLDEAVLSLLGAAREATINAAKWSGAPSVAVYVEVEHDQISVFVRDLGRGFELGDVPADRQGISRSIIERMSRHSGSATIRTAEGVGTEVELILPLVSAP